MSHSEKIVEAAERYLSRQPISVMLSGMAFYDAQQLIRAFCAGEIAEIESAADPDKPSPGNRTITGKTVREEACDLLPPSSEIDRCPICAEAFKADDICATDITEGTCHAACLEGSPVVDIETGEEEQDGVATTFRYGGHPNRKTSGEPVAWLRLGSKEPIQGVPWGAMWITDETDPKGFPVYRHPSPQSQTDGRSVANFEAHLARILDEYEQRREAIQEDEEVKARFITFRAFELALSAVEGSEG